MTDESKPYREPVSGRWADTLNQITDGKDWSYDQFKQVLIALALIGNGQAVPAHHRPDTIDILNWTKYIDEMISLTNKNGKEHARVVFADKGKRLIVFSGRTKVGNVTETTLDYTPQPGREVYQIPIGSLHSHPLTILGNAEVIGNGFSGTDYKTFMSDPRQQFMIIIFAGNRKLMIMKTSVTPNNLTEESRDRRIDECQKDYIEHATGSLTARVVEFNKAMCVELGLTMFIDIPEQPGQMKRINVVS